MAYDSPITLRSAVMDTEKIDTAYYAALNMATDDEGLINDSLAFTYFYKLLTGAETAPVLH
jgi:hypothetical protein